MKTGSARFTFAALAATVCCLIATGAGAASPQAYRMRVRFLPAQEPSLYVQFLGGQLRIGDSPEAVAAAAPIKALRKQITSQGRNRAYQNYTFPETTLPVSLQGVERVRASFDFSRWTRLGKGRTRDEDEEESAYLAATFRLQKPDNEGVDWTLVYSSSGSPKPDQQYDEAPVVDVPALDNLKLVVVTEVERKKVGIGLRVQSGELAFDNVLRKAKPAQAEIEVTDKPGKVVHTQKGDLEKFGFT